MASVPFWFNSFRKHSDKFMKEWVKCKNCSHEWEKTVRGDDTTGGGV